MKNIPTEPPRASIKPKNYLVPIVFLIILMGLSIGVFTKSAQQLAQIPNTFSHTSTPTLTTISTLTSTPLFLGTVLPVPYSGSLGMSTPRLMYIPKLIIPYFCTWGCDHLRDRTPKTVSPPSTATFTPSPTATFTPSQTATSTPTKTNTVAPTPTWTSIPILFASPVAAVGGSIFVFIVCLVILIVLITRFTIQYSQRSNTK